MLSPTMEEAMNGQLNAELYSSYLYLAMAAYFESAGLSGCANWMRMQAQEEAFHAMKFFAHIGERGGRVRLAAIAAPPLEWASALAVFQDTLAHERKVTGLINGLLDQALAERDHASTNFLQWFVSEQVEEEANAGAIVDKLRLAGDASAPLFFLDTELAQRRFVMPGTGSAKPAAG
ncbi:MAG: ferritin [Thermodesulfobacteriota bacterium]